MITAAKFSGTFIITIFLIFNFSDFMGEEWLLSIFFSVGGTSATWLANYKASIWSQVDRLKNLDWELLHWPTAQ